MDYSLLLAAVPPDSASSTGRLSMGIIDYLRAYTMDKRVETAFKNLSAQRLVCAWAWLKQCGYPKKPDDQWKQVGRTHGTSWNRVLRPIMTFIQGVCSLTVSDVVFKMPVSVGQVRTTFHAEQPTIINPIEHLGVICAPKSRALCSVLIKSSLVSEFCREQIRYAGRFMRAMGTYFVADRNHGEDAEGCGETWSREFVVKCCLPKIRGGQDRQLFAATFPKSNESWILNLERPWCT